MKKHIKNDPPKSTEIQEDLDNERMGDLEDDQEELAENLNYDEQEDSYDLDAEPSARDFHHPSPYDSSAKGGEDMDSTWDEANLVVGNEYDEQGSFEEEMEESAIHIRDSKILELSKEDEELSETEEDLRDDLDEEGYPLNDGESPE